MGRNTGTHQLLRQLRADGVTCLFGNPGTSEQNILDARRGDEFRDLRYYLGSHEGSTVAMADAYARVTQRPAIVQLHSYAGLANGLGMLKYAHRGYTPMVVLAGEAGLRYEALDGQMAADLVSIARPVVKSDHNGPCAWRAVDPGSVVRLVRRAYKTAMTPPAGPVFLALPMDVLDVENHETIAPTSLIQSAAAPAPEAVSEAARILAGAQRPLILMGDGVAAAEAQNELVRVAELLGAVVWGGNCPEVNFPASHSLFGSLLGHMFGSDSRPITPSADAVLICGTTVLPEVFPSREGVFGPSARVLQFDLNTLELAKNFPVALPALANLKPALTMLAAELQKNLDSAGQEVARKRTEKLAAVRAEQQRREHQQDAEAQDRQTLHAARFFKVLASRMPKDAVIFDEALTHSPELCR